MNERDRIALSFLKRLAIDQKSTYYTFQTFDDDKTRKTKRKTLNKIFNCTGPQIKDVLPKLRKLNDQGAGIYVTVNETNLSGRKKEDITRIRAIFQEDDHGHGLNGCPLDPHITIESSPGKFHRYFLTNSSEINEFNAIQQAMVDHFGSDKHAKDVSRVLRVPGFYHKKDPKNPFLVKIKKMSKAKRYPWDVIKSALSDDCSSIIKDEELFGRAGKLIVEIALVKTALSHMDPDCEYDDWLKIGMALHSASEGGQEGFNLFDTWSREGASHKEGDCEQKWDSFSKKEHAVTIRTLYRMAREQGWDGMPSVSTNEHRSLLYTEQKRVLREFNHKYRLCKIEGSIRFVNRVVDQTENIGTVFFKAHELKMFVDEGLHFAKRLANGEYEAKRASVIDYIISSEINSPDVKKYEGVKFEPRSDMYASCSLPDESDRYYNLYCGLSKRLKKGEWPLIHDHIFTILCGRNREHFEYFLNFIAHMIQRPNKIPGVVIVFKSDQGAGKNIVLDEIVKMYGNAGAIITDREEIVGNFNSGIANKIILLLDEAVWGGEKKKRSILKGMVTGNYIRVNEKNVPRYTVKNYARILFTTNDDFIAPIERGDRRYFTPSVSNQYAFSRNHKNRKKYFKQLLNEIRGGGIRHMFYELSQRDISKFNPMEMPHSHNESKTFSMINSLDSADKWFLNILFNAGFSDEYGEPSMKGWKHGRVRVIPKLLHTNYLEYCRSLNFRFELDSQPKLIRAIGKITPLTRTKLSDPETKKRTRAYSFSRLSACRKNFETYLGTSINWEGDERFYEIIS